MMREAFDDDDLEKKDTEITLGLPSLLGIFFGLVLICGIFFGFGYSLGRGSSHSNNATNPSASTPASSPVSSMEPSGSLSKPSAQQTVPLATPSADGNTASATPSTAPAAMTTTPGQQPGTVVASTAPVATPGSATPAPAVKTAVQPMTPAVARPAAPSQEYMVQIAAVRNPADATVLVSALRQHGYRVIARFLPQDNLTHVQVGPFTNRAAANRMRARLQADGYNAILKP